MKLDFTLDQIEEFLKDLGFEWNGRMIVDSKKEEYRRAQLKDFKKPVWLCLKNENKKEIIQALTFVDKETFKLLRMEFKANLSSAWKDYINNKSSIAEIE